MKKVLSLLFALTMALSLAACGGSGNAPADGDAPTGGRGTYISMPWLSRFWMYLPVPVAGAAMIVFELEAVYNHIKSFYEKEDEAA